MPDFSELSKGPKVFFELPFDLPDIELFTMKNLITQTTLTLFISTLLLVIVALIIRRKITKRPGGLQVVAEKLVTMLYRMLAPRIQAMATMTLFFFAITEAKKITI